MCEIITMGWRLAWGVTPNFAMCHPQKCEVSPPKMRGVTPKNARCHPKKCEVSPSKKCEVSPPKMQGVTLKKMRGVTIKNERCHPQKCEVSPLKMRGVTPKNARCHPQKCEVSPQKMRGVTPKNARCHPKKCEASPQLLRGVTQKMEGWPLTSFSKITFPEANQLRVAIHCAWRSYGALPLLLLFLCYCKCGENARSHPDRSYYIYILGVCRIVIYAESEYSAEYTLPNPNILPNIRHCRIMKKICLIKRVFNADVQSS